MVIVIGLTSAFFFGLGLVTQQHVASAAPEEDRLSPRLLWGLVRRPLWLAGIVPWPEARCSRPWPLTRAV